MANSNTQIANLALSAIGTRSTIASVNENSAEARMILLHYQPSLDAVLQAARWNFARKQISLALLQDGTAGGTVPQPWLYEYAYPTDCVSARFIIPNVITDPAVAGAIVAVPQYMGNPVPFLVSSDTDVNGNEIKVILTNQPQAQLVYTKIVQSPAMFDSLFTNCFVAYLAHRICIALTGDKDMAKNQFQLAEDASRKAQASNDNEGLTVIDIAPDWMRVRGYVSDWGYPNGSMIYGGVQQLTMIA